MKKLLSVILVCTMLLSLVACGSDSKATEETKSGAGSSNASTSKTETATKKEDNSSKENTSTAPAVNMTFTWWGNQVRNERTQGALDLYSEQNAGITFDVQPAEWSDYWTKLATAAAGKSLPDLLQMDYKYLEQYVANGLLLDLTPYIESGALDVSKVSEGILKSGSSGDGVYAICAGINSPALLYNKTLLDGAGITIKDNMTIDEFLDVCREVYEKTGVKTNICYNNGENFIEYVVRSDGYVLFEKGKLGIENAEPLEKFFNLYETGIKEGWHLSADVFAEIDTDSVEQSPMIYFSSPETESWCAFNYSNQLTAMQGAAPEGIEIGITTWPAENPTTANYLKPSQFFSVSTDSKNPDEAVKVLNYLLNSVECNEILLAERGVPASSVVADAIAPKLDEINQGVVSFINNVVTPNCSAINPASPDGTSEILEQINILEEMVLYGQTTAKEAAEELFKKGNEILGRK